MSKKQELGGKRLGSGNNMQVEMHGYQRSTHDLSYLWRSTMASGTLVPFMNQVALPGDSWDIDIDVDVKTHPTVGPLFGSFKVQIDIFIAPIRLYQGQLHNNKLGIGMDMSKIKLPEMAIAAGAIDETKDPDNQQINPSSLLAYLGIRGLGHNEGTGDVARIFNAVPLLAYWEIYKNYYANKQETNGAYIHTVTQALIQTVTTVTLGASPVINFVGGGSNPTQITRSSGVRLNYTGTKPLPSQIMFNTNIGDIAASTLFRVATDFTGYINLTEPTQNTSNLFINYWRYLSATDERDVEPTVAMFPLSNIDDMRQNILAATNVGTAFRISDATAAPYGTPLIKGGSFWAKLAAQEGLGLKTYQSDLFNNWLNTETITGTNGINAITAISTAGGSFTIDTLNLSKKIYDMLNRVAVSGGTYDDWLDATYSHDRYRNTESPVYMGGLSRELVFQEVVSNAQSAGGQTEQPLGTLGGKGVMGKKKKGGRISIKIDEPAYIMGIVSLTPRLDYSQGNAWDVNLKTMNDFHKPALDEIGFQDLITDQMAWWDTLTTPAAVTTFKSAGKQPAWTNYMTNVNVVRGNFAIRDNEMFMTLNRRYERSATTNSIVDLTTYIDPVKFNQIFAQTSRDAQNFWVQIAADITARRKMSAKIMPNL